MDLLARLPAYEYSCSSRRNQYFQIAIEIRNLSIRSRHSNLSTYVEPLPFCQSNQETTGFEPTAGGELRTLIFALQLTP